MITKRLFRQNYLIFASIVLVFIAVAISASWILTSFERDRMFMRPAGMTRTLLMTFDPDPFKAIFKLNEFAENGKMEKHDLLDADGKSLLSGAKILAEPLNAEQLAALEKDNSIQINRSFFPGPPPTLSTTNKPGVFLYSKFGPPRGKPPVGPIVTLIALVACVLLSIGVALFYQFSKYRVRAVEALQVLVSLREGNLSARLPENDKDELAPLTQAFNEMAGDLEHMVDQLRKADSTRRQLLQDLAHDLRTPLTSLKTFLETLQTSGQKLNEEKRQEVLSLCSSEVEYFGKLVEDLLFLAQITEPKYSLGNERVSLRDKVNEQITVFKQRYPQLNFNVITHGDSFEVMGSSQLMDRLFRNAFENSSSFARSQVTIDLSHVDHTVKISLLDDGPGFSAKALSEFGHKKSSRALTGPSDSKRISVGIGSVIMKEIAQLHAGHLSAENIYRDNNVTGAKVSFSFSVS